MTVDFKDWLLHGPKSEAFADLLDEIVEERRAGVLPDDGSSIFDEK